MSNSQPINEIGELLESFCSRFLDAETSGFTRKLLARVTRKRKLDLSRGRKEIWAAAIVYVIARLNFMFDPANERALTPDLIVEFFRANKHTVSNKATQIERACGLEMVEPDLCRQEIVEALSFIELPGGFILPAGSRGLEIMMELLEGEQAEQPEKEIAKRQRQKEKQTQEKKIYRAETNRKMTIQKKDNKRETQPSLFDF